MKFLLNSPKEQKRIILKQMILSKNRNSGPTFFFPGCDLALPAELQGEKNKRLFIITGMREKPLMQLPMKIGEKRNNNIMARGFDNFTNREINGKIDRDLRERPRLGGHDLLLFCGQILFRTYRVLCKGSELSME